MLVVMVRMTVVICIFLFGFSKEAGHIWHFSRFGLEWLKMTGKEEGMVFYWFDSI